ncbi:MAG: LPS export ABC transporter permease LptF [Alphaproteobacteria bacterium]|nr:MAG: LPS export ABC transporter permease LptF [Alphaproteobacteria bacterium]
MLQPLARIDRYVLRQVMFPLLVTLGVAALLLLLERMLRIFDFVITQGGPLDVVWKMLGNLIPHYLGLALPVGLFLGVQLAVRKMSTTSELDAMRSVGVGLQRLLRPTLLLSAVLMVFSILLTGYLQPYSRYAYATLAFEVRSGTLGASIKAGEFTSLGKGVTLRIESSRDGGRRLEHIFIQKESASGRITAITARQGAFYTTGDHEALVLRLEDGVLLDIDLDQPKPRVLTFRTHDFTIGLPEVEAFRERGVRTRELTLPELRERALAGGPDASTYNAAFHARIARAVSLLVIPFFGIALGMAAKRSNSALGLTFGIVVMLLVHKVMEFGEVYSGVEGTSVWLTLWLPVVMFALLSLRLFQVAAYRVGGSPLAALEWSWALISGGIASLLSRLRKQTQW